MAIGLVSDITRSIGERSQPYCDTFMNHLLNNLRSTDLSNQFKPAILQCFGDIAGAIGGHFETYLSVVAQVLEQASTVTASPEGPYEMFDYVISLREGIMDAWGGIIGAMKASNKSKPTSDSRKIPANIFSAQALQQYVQSIFQLLNLIASDMNRSESLMRAAMGVIGYVPHSLF
jgi:importin subunit beta-1